jgi:uncharacterized protein YhbP (UPF0306 family)
MNKKQGVEIARKIVDSNIYMTLATSDDVSWAAPVYYAVDDEYNFYFISRLNTVHSENIFKNGKVSFAIFDSRQKEGSGNGVQGYGTARLISNSEIDQALEWYKSKFLPMKPDTFKSPNPYRFFKLEPKQFYILDPDAKVDKRVEVKI